MGSKDDVLLVEEVVVIHPRHARVDSQQNQGQEGAGAANTGAGATNNATNVASDKSVAIEHSGSQAEVAADLWARVNVARIIPVVSSNMFATRSKAKCRAWLSTI